MDDDVTTNKITDIHGGESSRTNEDEIDSSFINSQHEEDTRIDDDVTTNVTDIHGGESSRTI